MVIKYTKCHPDAQAPEVQCSPTTNVGWDLRSCEPVVLEPYTPTLIHTGIKLEIPILHFGLLALRSGIALDSVMLCNGVGIIDPSYRGEICFLINFIPKEPWKIYRIEKGERIGQILILPYEAFKRFEEIELLGQTERGESGFGSTGRF